ncbi:hypothetical protein [Blastococcus mobilis]|uniref:Uncharacterized protein n=1 Tax=Blastococcus mobilis TaxID=1938746 RepID=A0A238YQD8_9ACTN|nr:hypothetical protein [Blastococcus mobilis]SNR73018.1 hypothetical protein SAMN06272737_12190 [Blastococcus mobilis]
MNSPTPQVAGPQVLVRGEALLRVEPEPADDIGPGGGALRVAAPIASMARFESSEVHLDLTPPRQEVHGAVEVRFAMSEPDQEVIRG